MNHALNRREFLASSAAFGLGLAASGRLLADAPSVLPRLKKALIVPRPTEAILKPIKEAGFDGVETTDWRATEDQAKAAREIAEKLGLRVHSVLFGWANFNGGPDAAAKSIADVTAALSAASVYGVDTLLTVPCRVGASKDLLIPEPWEFQIEFDEKTCHVTKVVEGDNAKYQKYIDAQNLAVDTSRDAVTKLIPVAEKAKVVIALENVWNNLWVAPKYWATFVRSFQNPWVKAYMDLGNHVKYRPPQEWVEALGPLVAKCHVKDFKLNEDGHGGKFVNIRDGSIDWPKVRQALADIKYAGWMTIEGGNLSLAEHSKRLDLIIDGK